MDSQDAYPPCHVLCDVLVLLADLGF
jgi:hypothetical protein